MAAGDVVFDIGANIGAYSAAFLGLGARVVAVEPQPQLSRYLRQRLGRYGPRWDIVQGAVTNAPGDVMLHLTSVDSLASLDPTFHQLEEDPHHDFVWDRTIVVPGITLDALVAEFGMPAGIKIDVEGHELPALQSLSRGNPWIFFEATPGRSSNVIDLLACRGYDRFWCRFDEHGGWSQDAPVDANAIRQMLANASDTIDILAMHPA